MREPTDQRLRAAERAFFADPDEPAALARLERECERAGLPLPYEALARTARWRPFRELVARWFAAFRMAANLNLNLNQE